ncbi:uracil-DNA glycosylase family protein [Thioclava sp. BHET1]|uniref:Uracil-DNA glycosylase n=1 Tax=Thioclava dalianensis TaxID=1185766 RepID=A0A074U5H2_9RHOB|nr:uracil-DNA glycosylase family protein [Thioclava dalianensis]KEP69882.1 uracil-DNA glycosylase [Thioclava dalianensis]TMV92389.1 uracil-DNA glycosylase family protein [Thioclava sp. BHET1]SFN16709.1 Uracil-DNA glycosylase [Thioclava dalianensis]
MPSVQQKIAACQICAQRFSATATRHEPRPVVWFERGARILIVGQAPGLRVHESGRPFTDRSGDRLRDWMGIDAQTFYDRKRIAITPMAFCFPGYDGTGTDLPPPPICAQTWHEAVMAEIGTPDLTLLVGGAAQRWYLGTRNVTQTVAGWRAHLPALLPLPHPSWRNTGWLKRNPWFAEALLPVLRARVKELT